MGCIVGFSVMGNKVTRFKKIPNACVTPHRPFIGTPNPFKQAIMVLKNKIYITLYYMLIRCEQWGFEGRVTRWWTLKNYITFKWTQYRSIIGLLQALYRPIVNPIGFKNKICNTIHVGYTLWGLRGLGNKFTRFINI